MYTEGRMGGNDYTSNKRIILLYCVHWTFDDRSRTNRLNNPSDSAQFLSILWISVWYLYII